MYLCPKCNSEVFVGTVIVRCLRCARDLEAKTLNVPLKLKGRGKVVICTIHNRTPDMEGIDKHLLAVGKPKGETYFNLGWEHYPGLAPSRDLVTFTKEHNRGGKLDGWFERYTESLLDEWATRKDAMEQFIQLRKWLDKGLNVAVACYCHPSKRDICHLSILREILESMEYEVREARPIPYRLRG